MERDEILARIDSSWREFQTALEGMPAERATDPGVSGDWSVRDILGHLAYWEEIAAKGIAGAFGEDSGSNLSIDELNAQEAGRISQMSYEEAVAALNQSHALLVETATAAEGLKADQVEGDSWEH